LQADLLGDDANILLVDEVGALVAAHRGSEAAISVARDQTDACSLRFTWSAKRGGVVTCALPLGSLGWALVAEQSAEKVFQPLVIMLPALLTTGAIMVLAFTLLAAQLASATTRPARVLYRGIISVARGDLSVQIPQNRAPGEMDSLVAAFNYMVRQFGERSRLVEDSQRALEKQNLSYQDKFQSASELSVTDPLTQLHNRRFFDHQLKCETKRLDRKGEGFCLLMIDIDDFKKMNDTFGHAAGDDFLKQIARILQESVRATDLLARFGGEEFVVVATSTNIEGAVVLAEKMRTAVAEASFIVDESMRPRRATISIGVARYKGSQTGLFNAADAALYSAKDSGKNCVVADDV
jgi:diguanylate cyclase (GGDEF)-like protein